MFLHKILLFKQTHDYSTDLELPFPFNLIKVELSHLRSTYSILVSNHSKVEAEMIEYKTAFTGKLLTESIFSDNFHYKYMAIKYVSNGSAGSLTIYLERKKKEVVLV